MASARVKDEQVFKPVVIELQIGTKKELDALATIFSLNRMKNYFRGDLYSLGTCISKVLESLGANKASYIEWWDDSNE